MASEGGREGLAQGLKHPRHFERRFAWFLRKSMFVTSVWVNIRMKVHGFKCWIPSRDI